MIGKDKKPIYVTIQATQNDPTRRIMNCDLINRNNFLKIEKVLMNMSKTSLMSENYSKVVYLAPALLIFNYTPGKKRNPY